MSFRGEHDECLATESNVTSGCRQRCKEEEGHWGVDASASAPLLFAGIIGVSVNTTNNRRIYCVNICYSGYVDGAGKDSRLTRELALIVDTNTNA